MSENNNKSEKRPSDKYEFLDNYHYQKSNYNKTQVINVKPDDYKNRI